MSNISWIFDDAHRRVCIAKARGETDRQKIWSGLAVPSSMKEVIARGWMKPVHNVTPRVLNWYTFIEEGWAEYDRRYADKPDWFAAA